MDIGYWEFGIKHFSMQTLSPPYDRVTRHGGLCFADITYLPLKVVEGAAEVKKINEKMQGVEAASRNST